MSKEMFKPLMILSTFFLVAGLILTIVSTVFPGWHIVQSTADDQTYQHGMWLSCAKGSSLEFLDSRDDWRCVLEGPLYDGQIRRIFRGWHRPVVVLLAVALTTGLVALVVSFFGFCDKWFTLGWCAASLLALVCQTAAVIVFIVNGHDYDNWGIQVTGPKPVYTQRKGYAFWCAAAGVGCYLLNFVLAVAVAILSFLHDRRLPKSWPQSYDGF